MREGALSAGAPPARPVVGGAGGPPRLLVGNLDAEADLAVLWAAAAAGAAPGGPVRRLGWTRQAAAAAAAAATLLRALARPGDRLWLPAPVLAERWGELGEVPLPTVVTGPLGAAGAALGGVAEVLAWCETPAVEALRRRLGERQRADELPGVPAPEPAHGLAAEPARGRAEAACCMAAESALGMAMEAARGVAAETARSRATETARGRGAVPACGVAMEPATGPASDSAWDPSPDAAPLHEVLWRLPRPRPAVVAAVHHRGFCLEVQRRLGRALPGARMVESSAELGEMLARGAGAGAAAGTGAWESPWGAAAGGGCGAGSWVLKAPLSAAGRWRAIHHDGAVHGGWSDAGFRRHVDRLFARHGALLFEPWVERVADLGAAGLVSPEGVRWVGFHRQHVDAHGQVVGLDLDAGAAGAAAEELRVEDMAAGERAAWQRALDDVGAALRRAGYVGPFGVDAWRWRGSDGRACLHPVGEINARLTLGLLARALVDRLRAPLGLGAGDRVGLRFGRPPQGGARGEIVPLLRAGAAHEPAVWLELVRGAGWRA